MAKSCAGVTLTKAKKRWMTILNIGNPVLLELTGKLRVIKHRLEPFPGKWCV